MLLQLFSPANLLLDFLKTFKEKHVEVRVDPDPAVRLANSPVLKHETHPFFFKLEGCDGVPGELDNLVLQTAVLSASCCSSSSKAAREEELPLINELSTMSKHQLK